MEEEEKAEEQAPFESAEQSGGNQTELLTQTDFSNVDQQAYSNAVEIDPPPSTITMEDDNADEPSLHFEDDLEEAGMDEAPGSSILDAKLGGSLRQVSFHKDLCIAGSHDSLKDVSYHNHDTSTQGSSSCNDQTEMGDSMTSMNSNHVEQLKPISDSSAPDDAKTFVKNKKRVSLVVDIESGKEGARAQTALVRVWTFACGCRNVRSGFLNSCFVVYVIYRFEISRSVDLLVWELVDVEESNTSYPTTHCVTHFGATQQTNPTRNILMTQ